jgi:SAM-dependent methyltransferase
MYPGCNFYGIREIILEYSKLPKFLPLPVAIQHGWQRFPHAFEASSNPPEIWVWSPRLKQGLESFYPTKKIRTVGSFFNYLLANQAKEAALERPVGSICIPPHSSHFAETLYSASDFVEQLKSLDDQYKPITVMLYYLDMSKATVDLYEGAGFKVVSNGALFDNDFLKRFVSHVSGKRYCIYSDLGSGVFYASLLGAEPIKIDLPSIVVNKGNHHITEKMISEVSAFDDEFVKSMTTQKVNEEMGLDFMLSPSQMRALIIKNYFTFSFAKVFIKRSLSVPYRWVRNMYHRQSFQPGLIGLFVNPFYFARKALYQAINAVSGEMTGRLLDVGCGSKPYQPFFPEADYVGLDIDTEVARKRGVADHFYNGDIFPFETSSFDSVLCNQVLEHVFNPDDFLNEVNRVLKPSGKLLLTVPFVWDEHEQPYDYARYSSFGLRSLLEKHGFSIVKHEKLGGDATILFQLTNAYLYKVTGRWPRLLKFGFMVVVMGPINLLGVVAGKLLPANPDLFLDQVVLAEKRP